MSDDSDIVLHGISNCDTIRKARRWLADNGLDHRLHDFRKDGIDAAWLEAWASSLDDWQVLLNRRGTTWRQLPAERKEDLDENSAIALMVEHPAVIKRPVLVRGDRVLVGFDETRYRALLDEPEAQ